MESARRACGGHGYSLLSGLPTTFTHYVQNVTWEGDNNVMLLQVGPLAWSTGSGALFWQMETRRSPMIPNLTGWLRCGWLRFFSWVSLLQG